MLLSAVQNSFSSGYIWKIKAEKLIQTCAGVRSLTDPIEEHKDTMSLDLDFEYF